MFRYGWKNDQQKKVLDFVVGKHFMRSNYLKHICVSSIALMLTMSMIPFAEAGEEKLPLLNPGFEDGKTGWTITDREMSRLSPEAARTGRMGLRVADECDKTGSSCISNQVPVEGSQKYAVSFSARVIRGSNVLGVYQRYYNSKGHLLNTYKLRNEIMFRISAPPGEWEEYFFHGQAPANAATMAIWIHSYNSATGIVDLDDFSISKVDEEKLARTTLAKLRNVESSPLMDKITAALQANIGTRPSIFISPDRKKELISRVSGDPFFRAMADAIIREANDLTGKPPVERKMEGRRLLSVSRDCLGRIIRLGIAFRLTGEDKYFKQAEAEMLAAAGFSDWNPGHFLDVGEMSAALGIGYDWFYEHLSPENRNIIREAIVQKALKISFAPPGRSSHIWFLNASNNWNPVCNAGLVIGALAIRQEEPALAANIIHRALRTVKKAMDEYNPDGAYPEGPMYWGYGTGFNVMLIDALNSVLGKSFGLSEHEGFAKSGDYFLNMIAPSGTYFNYSDCHLGGGSPLILWFARQYDKPYLNWHEMRKLWPEGATEIRRKFGWWNALQILWVDSPETAVPPYLHWMGRGRTPVAVFRSSWVAPDAAYLAVKGGTARASHGHMDAGSFVYEADGVRWAIDLGMQGYHAMESRGLKIWSSLQNSDRWKIFRYNSFSHNTITVNNELHRVDGFADIISFSDDTDHPYAIIDMSEVFTGQLASATRGVTLLPSRQALIQDEIKAADKPAVVRWAMIAPGKVEILTPTTARLSEAGKTLLLNVQSSKTIQLKTYSTESREEWDARNPNTYMIGFELELKAGEEASTMVTLTPGSIPADKRESHELTPLAKWTKN